MQPAGSYIRERRSCIVCDGPFGRRAYTNVYAIDAPDIGRIKFGMTSNVARRFRGISNISPAPVSLLGSILLPEDGEAYVFNFLKADRCHGEWFYRTEPVRSIAALIAAKDAKTLAEVLGMEGFLAKDVPSNVSWGARY